jgi:spermidine/putrescine transport system permease protein
VLFAIIPFILILIISFTTPSDIGLFSFEFNLSNYTNLISYTYFKIFLRSFFLAGTCTLVTLLIGYPFAYILARTKERIKNLLLVLVIIPFWTSSLIRSYAMIAILKTKGLINHLLLICGIIHTPLQLLYTNTSVLIGLIYNLLPFMVLPLYANIERLDQNLVDAARDLGANWFTTFRRVIIPLTLPGIISGCIIVLLPAMTLFYIPDILGGAKSMLLGNLIQDQFLFANNWPQGAAISVILTLLMMILLWVYWRNTKAKDRHAFL